MKNRLKHTILFFAIAFLWTWSFYLAIILFKLDPYHGTGMVFLILGGCSPTFTGLIMAMVTYNKQKRIDYLKRIYQLKCTKPIWWIAIILIFPAIFAVSIGLDMLLGGSLPGMVNLKAVIASPLSFIPLILLSFMSGPFAEELGWRGFALDPLLSRFGFTKASVMLGFIWGVWHLPLFFMPQTWHGQMGFQFSGFWMFILFSIGLSLMMSLVYININRSILAAMLMHLFSNFTGQLLDPLSSNALMTKGLIVLAIGLGIALYMITTKKDTVLKMNDISRVSELGQAQ